MIRKEIQGIKKENLVLYNILVAILAATEHAKNMMGKESTYYVYYVLSAFSMTFLRNRNSFLLFT